MVVEIRPKSKLGMGQSEKNSVRVHVFRFALKLGHRSTQLALRFVTRAEVTTANPSARNWFEATRPHLSRLLYIWVKGYLRRTDRRWRKEVIRDALAIKRLVVSRKK